MIRSQMIPIENIEEVTTMDKKSVKRRIVEISNKIRISKDCKNEFAGYNYFNLDAILEKLNPMLEENELFISFNMAQLGGFYHCELTISDFDTNDNSVIITIDIDKSTVSKGNSTQASGSCMTYGKKYLLMNCFGISENKLDPDSQEHNIPAKQAIPETHNTPNNTPINKKHNTHSKLYSLARTAGITNEQIHLWIEKKFNKVSIKDLTTSEYSELLNSIQKKVA